MQEYSPQPYPTVTGYPLTYNVDYPDRELNRLTTGLRFLWIIPIGIIAGLLSSGTISVEGMGYSWGSVLTCVQKLLREGQEKRSWYACDAESPLREGAHHDPGQEYSSTV